MSEITLYYSVNDDDSKYSIIVDYFSSMDELLEEECEHERIAENCADDYFDHHDGWEIFGEQNSTSNILLYANDKEDCEAFAEFEVECVYYPSFDATKIKPTNPTSENRKG